LPIGGDTQRLASDLSGGSWPGVTDIAEYYFRNTPYGDARFDFSVPNQNYQVTIKPGADFFSEIDSIDVQGVPYFTNVAVQATAQGLYKPLDLLVNTTVTTGTLSIVIRQASNAVPGGVGTDINAIQIVPGGPGYIRSIPGHMP